MISLFRLDGNVGSSIGVDTVCNGRFHFQKETLGDEVETLMLSGRSDKFPPHELQALGASGKQHTDYRRKHLDTDLGGEKQCPGASGLPSLYQ